MAFNFQPPYYGAAYYPEDWPLEQIDQDVALMKKYGVNVVRVAEFAWSRMEPKLGQFDFGWLHTMLDKCAAAGIATIMGTPSATPPVWLVERDPEVLYVHPDGRTVTHGARRHTCPTNAKYREHCARIVNRMAEEFGQDERIIGWQIDNELSPFYNLQPPSFNMIEPMFMPCGCPSCKRAFAAWLQKRYGTVEKLNERWCNNLWSQTYDTFEQVPTPRQDLWHHPALRQVWNEFSSDAYTDFSNQQADILHAKTRHPIGTDMMMLAVLDYYDVNARLDIVQHNHYHAANDLHSAAFWFDYCRPIKSRPFWNTETMVSTGGATSSGGLSPQGFCRINSWLPYALGGEANMYWHWREHWAGQELMMSAILQSDGRPVFNIDEVLELSGGLKKAGPFLRDTRPAAGGVALHFSHLAYWMFQAQPMMPGFNYMAAMSGAYHALIQAQLRPDVLSPKASLAGQKLLVSPFLPAIDEGGLRERLKAWIEAGGTWVAGPLTDNRTLDGSKYTHAPFGSLEEWTGAQCRFFLPAVPLEFKVRWAADDRLTSGSVTYDSLEIGEPAKANKTAQPLATYADAPYLDGSAAIVRAKLGKGQIIQLGTMPQPADFQRLLAQLAVECGIQPFPASDNVLAVPRVSGGEHSPQPAGLIALELQQREGTLTLPRPAIDLLTGMRHEGEVKLAPFSAMVLQYV